MEKVKIKLVENIKLENTENTKIKDTKNQNSWNLIKLFKKQAHPSWHTPEIISHLTSKKTQKLEKFLNNKDNEIFPPQHLIFNTFKLPLENVKVVILGQDPYINKDQAMGMSFSVPDSTATPPSLQNIFKEIKSDTGLNCSSPNLSKWLDQGVFLLNTTLTVDSGNSNSHAGKGWGEFTDAVIEIISKSNKNCVFILWGGFAQSKKKLVHNEKSHCIICSAHPSPLSAHRGFLNSRPFSITNNYLNAHNKTPINWQT